MVLRILWCSPLPPTRSGVSDYAVELLRPLSHSARVRVLSPPGGAPPQIPDDIDVEVVANDTEPAGGEIPLIHLGNNPHHIWLVDRCSRMAPVIVVHDLVLHHLIVEYAAAGENPSALGRLLDVAHPGAGAALVRAREHGIRGRLDPFLFPARRALLAEARALVTHSRWGERLLGREFPDKPVFRLGLAVEDPYPVDRDALRMDIGVADDEYLVMHLGFLTREKGLQSVLAAVAAARESGAPVRVLLLGDPGDRGFLEKSIAACGLGGVVDSTGWLPWSKMIKYPAAADLGIVMRVPSAGETSAAVVRFLACGTPVAVVGQRQFLEWPEVPAPRITPGPSAQADISRFLIAAVSDPMRAARREAARRTYEERHQPHHAASDLVGFLSSL